MCIYIYMRVYVCMHVYIYIYMCTALVLGVSSAVSPRLFCRGRLALLNSLQGPGILGMISNKAVFQKPRGLANTAP